MIIALFSPKIVISSVNRLKMLSVNMRIRKLFREILVYLLVLFMAHLILFADIASAESIQKDTDVVHWVSPGESLYKIARRYLPLSEELGV